MPQVSYLKKHTNSFHSFVLSAFHTATRRYEQVRTSYRSRCNHMNKISETSFTLKNIINIGLWFDLLKQILVVAIQLIWLPVVCTCDTAVEPVDCNVIVVY